MGGQLKGSIRTLKMKLASFLVLATATTTAQEGRALSLDARIGNAQEKCRYFMDKAMYCEPPNGKKSKYVFRLNKIMFDSVHHVSRGKCASGKGANNYNSYRRRRDIDELEEEFANVRDEIEADAASDDDFSAKGYGNGNSAPKPQVIDRLENICRKYMATVWNAPEVENCKKLGSWERRSKGLLNDLTIMKNVCKNQVNDDDKADDDKYSNSGKPSSSKPNNNNNGGYNNKPSNKPTKKPSKK